ncbi:hypothetical protein CASFOL_022637 [Castilleja foliolosa]|uniref:Ubiquitin-like protease family profile domain-containing protein n=1 Tax=Castilleja foliolosa TaxID=1961234 RepID=A0ABD3CV49_9LAMI
MVDYVRHRQVGEPPSTPIDERFYLQNCKPLTPIRITKAELFKHQDKGKDSERDIGNTVPEIASFFKEIENPTNLMETPAIDAYLRILKFNPDNLGCHPEGKGKYTIMGHIFCPNIIPEEVKGQAEKLDPDEEQVEILLNLVQGKTKLYLTDKWVPQVPFTEVEKCFYDVRKDLKPLNREWDLRFGDKNYCFTQEDGLSCGPFSLKMMEVLVSRRALPNITEENMKFIRRGIAERIFSFSKPEKDSTK